MRRYPDFDRLRVAALMMILACHFVRSIGFYSLDLALGAVGNFIFFVLSGWLLGLAWQGTGSGSLGLSWLKRRLTRLALPLWVFAIPYFVLLLLTGFDLKITDVVMNLFLLNWFARLPGMTPYWFITAIAGFYLVVAAITHIGRLNENRLKVILTAIAVVGVAQAGFAMVGVRQGYVFALFVCGVIAFCFASEMLEFVERLRKNNARMIPLVCIGGAIFICEWIGFANGWIETGTTHCYWITMPVACAISMAILLLPRICTKGITFLSGISFEMYLVHSAMLGWTRPLTDNVMVYLVLFLTGTIVAGLAINKAALVAKRFLGA